MCEDVSYIATWWGIWWCDKLCVFNQGSRHKESKIHENELYRH